MNQLQRISILAGALCGLLLAACGPAENAVMESRAEERHGQGPRVLLIAVDGLEPSLLQEMMGRGELPAFQSLVEAGSMAIIDSTVGTTSPVVWTTVATGTAPEDHGITGFTIDEQPVTSTMRRRPAFWDILPKWDLEVATIGWMVTWPAEDDAGLIVSDRTHWGRFADKIAPRSAMDLSALADRSKYPDPRQVVARFSAFPFDPDYETLPRDDRRYAINFLLDRRLINIFNRDNTYARIAEEVMGSRDLDLMAVYFQGIDYVSHGFWQWFEPEPYRQEGWQISDAEIEQLSEIIPKYYRYLDRLLGDLLDKAGADTLTLLLSDHGFGTGLGKYRVKGGDFISGNHRGDAVFIVSGEEAVDGQPQLNAVTHFDILPTLLYSLGLPVARDQRGLLQIRYFTSEAVARRDLRLVDTYRPDEEMAAEVDPTDSEHDEEILDELRSLGYIQ